MSWLEQHNIHCMASGSLDGVTKYYLYAKEVRANVARLSCTSGWLIEWICSRARVVRYT